MIIGIYGHSPTRGGGPPVPRLLLESIGLEGLSTLARLLQVVDTTSRFILSNIINRGSQITESWQPSY